MQQLDDYPTRLLQPVRWGDMDALGHVNNAVYFTYCESARMHYFQVVGMDEVRLLDSEGPTLATATCNFRHQVKHPATLEVGVKAIKLGTSSFTLQYGVFDQDAGTLVADGTSVVVWFDYGAARSRPVPDWLRANLRNLDGVS